MSEFQQKVNQSYEPILASVPKGGWGSPEIPVAVMDPQTHHLIQIDDLYRAINFTRTRTGGWVLRRSVNQPLTDAALITEKQRSLDELRSDPELRGRVTGFVEGVVDDEEKLYRLYKDDYSTVMYGRPSIYNAYKGSTRLLGRLAHNLAGVRPETDYLAALTDNLTALREDNDYRFIRGPVYRTLFGLRPKEEVGILTPRLRFFKTDWKPVRLLFLGAPIALVFAGMSSEDRNLIILSAYGGMAYMVWPSIVTSLGRKFDNRTYVKPLAKMYFNNPNVVNAIETLGKMDELLSLADYADCLQVPVTLPQVEDAPAHYFEARGLRNPVLAKGKPDYVPNHVDLNGSRLTFLTGPNSGGKTSLSKTILQSQILAQIGSYIPAEQAKIAVADGIYYHSPMVNSLQDEEGRFGVEIARTRDIFLKATPKTIVILDELIEATTYAEKIRHSTDILEGFYAIGGNTVLVTHNHELAAHFRDKNRGQFWQVEFDGPTPTHRVVSGISTESHSDDVLQRLGFTGADIQEHLRISGYIS